jgi:hypothetical protein
VNEVEFLVELFVALVAVTGPFILLVRLIAGDPDVERPHRNPEPEPPRWHVAPAP